MAVKASRAECAERRSWHPNTRNVRHTIAASVRSNVIRPVSGTLFKLSQQRLMNIYWQEVGDISFMARHFFHQ